MKFQLVDKIVSIEPPTRIVTTKALSLAEEYLKDHFPGFPVMPGVLMIETMVQAAAWLVRATTDFAHSMICLAEVRNIKYGAFVHPGEQLQVEVEALRIEADSAMFKGVGRVAGAGEANVSGRFGLRMYDLVEKHAELADVDRKIRQHYRRQFVIVGGAALMGAVAASPGKEPPHAF